MTRADLPSLAAAEALDPRVVAALRESGRRIVIVGASGWVGKCLLAGLWHALGEQGMCARVVCFGSSARRIEFGQGRWVEQQPLEALAGLSQSPSLLFHLAFLTKDKVAAMAEADYVAANRAISAAVYDALEPIGVDRVFVASSGAAAFADDAEAAHDLRLYGSLKREDERTFAGWATGQGGRRAMIMRIYSLAGPFINKHETYALASFIADALAERPITIKAPMEVVRAYVAVRELLSVVLACLLDETVATPVLELDSGGTRVELGELAGLICSQLGGTVARATPDGRAANIFVPDARQYTALRDRFGIAAVDLEQCVLETATFLAD